MIISKNRIHNLPKIDLHRHWDGDVRPDVIYELGRKSGIELPAKNPAELNLYFKELRNQGLGSLLQNGFGLVTSLLQSEENIYIAAYEEVRNLAEDKIIYAEVRFAPQYHTGESEYYRHSKNKESLSYEEVIKSLYNGLKKGAEDFGVKTNIIVCIGREADPCVGMNIVKAALACMDSGVVGIDLACNEAVYPPERHFEAYKLTFGTPLKRTVHAGEFGNLLYTNIETSIEKLKADRLGHARLAGSYDELINLALKNNIGIESCPESNRFVGLIKSSRELSIDKLLSKNVLVSINSDDPAMFGYTLTDTIHRTAEEYDFSLEELKKLQLNAAESAFLNDNEKQKLRKKITANYSEATK